MIFEIAVVVSSVVCFVIGLPVIVYKFLTE